MWQSVEPQEQDKIDCTNQITTSWLNLMSAIFIIAGAESVNNNIMTIWNHWFRLVLWQSWGLLWFSKVSLLITSFNDYSSSWLFLATFLMTGCNWLVIDPTNSNWLVTGLTGSKWLATGHSFTLTGLMALSTWINRVFAKFHPPATIQPD